MSHTTRRIAFAIALAGLPVPSCGKPSRLAGAAYGDQIPVYPDATLRDTGGGTYADALGGPVTFESKSWFFTIGDGAKVIAFYQQKLPGATREDDEDGVSFRFTPRGGQPGEDISVVIRKGELQISEVVKPGKRAR
jgi:hypothetical protein